MSDFANDWCFGGEVVTFRAMNNSDGQFGGAMTLKGVSQRSGSKKHSTNVGFIVTNNVWKQLIKDDVKVGDVVEVAGHFEQWTRTTEGGNEKQKVRYVVDQYLGRIDL